MQFQGGLGNQMFEYACYRALVCRGKHVRLDNSFYIRKSCAYAIGKFPNIKMKRFRGFHNYLYFAVMGAFRKICRFIHMSYSENMELPYDEKVFEQNAGLLCGYFQNEYYFRDIMEIIREELRFPDGEIKLQEKIQKIEDGFYISIHIRRKDYLELSDIYGGICDKRYYQEAVSIMQDKYPFAEFLVFSDDISWVKKNMDIPNAQIIPREYFDSYEDWYDMCLMSHCRHHITANSTFSWWGAWLNPDKGKTVICPKRWDNRYLERGLACDGWIAL